MDVRRRPGAPAHRGRHRTPRRRVGARSPTVVLDPAAPRRPRPRGDGRHTGGAGRALRRQAMRLHAFLRDQGAIAGLGRRLANEVCHRAKLSPFASTTKLGLDGAKQVVAAIHEAVDEGLAYERGRPDMSSSADRPGAVHHRTGEPCPVCGDTVREVAYTQIPGQLLPDLPDRRQGAGRQHHEQVPQVGQRPPSAVGAGLVELTGVAALPRSRDARGYGHQEGLRRWIMRSHDEACWPAWAWRPAPPRSVPGSARPAPHRPARAWPSGPPASTPPRWWPACRTS